jgi:26S proteasome non-ATPase regulatory subunit 5
MEMEQEQTDPILELLATLQQQPPPGDETILDSLSQLNIIASNDTHRFRSVVPNINVDAIFALVQRHTASQRNRNEQNHVTGTCCQVLRNVFANMPTVDVMDRYGKYMHTEHTSQAVSVLCLQQVLRLAEEDNFSYFMSTPSLIQFSIHFLCEDGTEASGVAGKILGKLISLSGNGWLFNDDFIRLFKHLLSTKNSVTKFRIYDVFVEYVTKYPEYIEQCKQCGIFDDLIRVILHSEDVLSQLNALEMLSQIAVSSPQGLSFVQENGIIGWMGETFAKSESDPLISFLLPGCVKFFGVLCASNPMEIIPQYKPILKKIFEDVHGSDDPTLSCLCAETIAFICSKGNGLKVLYNSESDATKGVIRTMTKIVTNPGEDDYSRERILTSLTSMFDHDVNDVELTNICEKLYRYLGDSPMAYLLKLAQIPFAEIRHGSFTLLGHISKYSWVEQDMILCAGFMEYLLDRSTETEKDGHELKFNIIQNLSRSVTALDNFGPDYFGKLETYVNQGPFYSESHVVVAYDGDQ